MRFSRCTPTAVNAHLSPLGFRPSSNNSLFHPAPLSLAVCTLEKVAHTASVPISLYSCPPQSVFRLHINKLSHLPSHRKKVAPVDSSNISQTTIRTTSSTEDIVVFIPPLRKQATSESLLSPKPFPPLDQPTAFDPGSNVSSFYANAPARNRQSKISILPLSAQAAQSPEGGKSDPLAVARSPPPWRILDINNSPTPPDPRVTVACHQGRFPCNVENSQRKQPTSRWTGQALDKPLKVDRDRLHKRSSDTVADMVHQFASKRPKIESEFALARTRAAASAKSRNPFVGSTRSVFAESSTQTSDMPPASTHEFSKETESTQLRVCRSLPSETVLPQGTEIKGTAKPLKPITSLKPPIFPKELLPPPPRCASKPKRNLKQTRLSFSRQDEEAEEL